jgi:hypothetical protein
MGSRRLLDLEPPAPADRRVGLDPAVLDGEGEEPAEHLDRLVDRGGRERATGSAERIGARPAFGETTPSVLGLLELVDPVGVDRPDVDLREQPVGKERQQMPERPFPVLGCRGPDFSAALDDLRLCKRAEGRRAILADAPSRQAARRRGGGGTQTSRPTSARIASITSSPRLRVQPSSGVLRVRYRRLPYARNRRANTFERPHGRSRTLFLHLSRTGRRLPVGAPPEQKF